MKDITLIIPSATLVPEELQKIGKLPGIIYPINQRIVFDYLYEQYKEACSSIDVICFQRADKVHRRLSSYRDSKLHIRDLEKLDDLGHTIYSALEGVDGTAIINFADTIVLDNIYETKTDAFFYAEDFTSNIWTYYEIENGVISKVYDKIESAVEDKKKLFVGVFQITDSACFRECLAESFSAVERGMSTFYYALCLYSRIHPLTEVNAVNWFDIGHADTYYNSKLEVKAREFNHITIDRDRGILKKSSEDKDKFIGEIMWYLKLPTDIEYVRPRIFGYSTAYTNPYVLMEYYAYHTLHELFLYGDLSKYQWKDIFTRIRFVCHDFKRYTVQDPNIKKSLEDMYLNKTLQRFERMKKDERFVSFFMNPVVVNGVQYQSLNEISEVLKKIIPEMLYDVEKFNIIHGDLCFANIMVDDNFSFIKVIDPRGKFGSYDIYGDCRYEMAKLFHSVDGKYDFIIKDLFTVEYDLARREIDYIIADRKRDFDLYKVFTETFKTEIGNELKKIELVEALLFLSMIPLHGESLNHQLVMLGTGIDILNRVVNIRC
ncbi:MAG: capsular biosynthesis protein [Eubacteriales bacterium]|nr:capsular biosynthesis protein [Eubacteriales bacterium]